MGKLFTYWRSLNAKLSTGIKAKAGKILFAILLLCCVTFRGYATAWTTATAGAINTLSNWTNGTSSPTTFTTPGDTWTITMTMTMPASSSWTVGAASSAPDTVIFAGGGVDSMNGAGSTANTTIYGVVMMSGGRLILNGAGTTHNFTNYGDFIVTSGTINSIASTTALHLNTTGNFYVNGGTLSSTGAGSILTLNNTGNISVTGGAITAGGATGSITLTINGNSAISGGTINTSGASSVLTMNTHGNFSMTAGSFAAGGASGVLTNNVYGNCSFSGAAVMTNTGASCMSTVHLALPTPSGTMLADNTSTGTWSGTNVYIDTGCTAQLDGNFSASTGAPTFSASYGITVNGTLICPAAYMINGTDNFTLNGVATLEVAIATGINGAIITSGTKAFALSANYVFNGTAAQVTGSYLPAALIAPDTITINNSAGVTLSQTTSTTGLLLFASGILHTTAAFTMSVPGAATDVVGAGATSYVDGTLIKTISGLTSVNYEVGDLDYAPTALTLSTAGTAGSLGLKATNGLHPSVATSGLSTANMANHYWTITNYSAAGPATVIPKATYDAADIIGGTNSAFETQEYSGTAWLGTPLATANTSSPYTSAPTTGITLATLPGAYIFGNIFCGTLPITGTPTVCPDATTSLSDATTGGTWVSSATSIASVSATGVVTGVSAGVATISYTQGTCTVTSVVTVNPLPDAGTITGADTTVCVGNNITLSDAATGGSWGMTNSTLATVSGGVVTGVAPGIDTITYYVANSCGNARAKYRVKILSAAACHAAVISVAQTSPSLVVFPNPNTGAFTINLLSADDEAVHVVITNIVGEKVSEVTTTTNKETDIHLNPAPGIYLLSATTANGRYNAKVVVR